MRYFALYVTTVVLALSAQNAAADEFGDRFYSQAPQGLGEYTAPDENTIPEIVLDDSTAEELQDVMPAAGDEDENAAEEAQKSDDADQSQE